jgi:hypothetical protein
MFAKLKGHGDWSGLGLRYLIFSVVLCVMLAVFDAAFRDRFDRGSLGWSVVILCQDLRSVFEQLMIAAAIVFVGAKFFETRTTLTVGFDSTDGSRVSVKGPDDDNTVWIGRRYDSPHEAQVVATVIAERIKTDAPAD